MDVPPQATTWAERNPQKNVQPVRTRRKLTDTEKANNKVRRQLRDKENNDRTADLEQYKQESEEKLEEIAHKYSCKTGQLKKLLNTSSAFKPSRRANLRNALVHRRAQEENADAPVGEKKPLREIQQLVSNDPELENLTPEQEEELLKELDEYRALKKTGARASNLAAAQDVHHVVTHVHTALADLAQRTGVYAFTFITRGHIDDLSHPAWYTTGDCTKFFQEVVKVNPWDLARLFEQWGCNQNTNAVERENLATMRTECATMIVNGLRRSNPKSWIAAVLAHPLKGHITRISKITMHYVKYEDAIVQRHSVKLIGWTCSRFINPADINSVPEIRVLRDALRSGACRWIRISPQELRHHTAEVDARRQQGEVIGKKRKERSDKGTKRKRRTTTDENNQDGESSGTQPAKKQRSGNIAKQMPPKSRAIVEDDDDEGEDGEAAP